MEKLLSILNPFLKQVADVNLKRLEDIAKKALPFPVEAFVDLFLSIPAVHDEIQKLEAMGIAEVDKLATETFGWIKTEFETFLHKHPVVATFYANLEGSPVMGQALKLGLDEVHALYGKQLVGEWDKVRGFLGLAQSPQTP